ncbi:MAG: efflux RND transporter periplasmic adaptor subunit [Planctomycetota bacterium]|jgi:membrane fusion protein (multidrug efflux system)
MKTFFGSILILLGVVGIGAIVAGLKYRSMMAPQFLPPESPTPVVIAQPGSSQIRQASTAIGTVVAPRSIQLKTESVGTVSTVHFQSGDVVQPGQVLLQLDTAVEEAMLQSARAAQRIAMSTFQRIKKAMETQALTESDRDQTEALLAQSEAEVKRIEAIIRRKTLVAPFPARAGLLDIHPGQYLPEGSLVTMLQGVDSYVFVDFMMPQQVADYLRVGNEVLIKHDGASFPAKIVATDSQSDRVTRSMLARARIDSPPETMHIHDSVRVDVEYGLSVPSMTVPSSALRSSPAGNFVYVVESDREHPDRSIARQRTVIPGPSVGNEIAILSGLQANETIVADGSFKISDGTWVAPSELTNTALQQRRN